jgi:hypothetical protein
MIDSTSLGFGKRTGGKAPRLRHARRSSKNTPNQPPSQPKVQSSADSYDGPSGKKSPEPGIQRSWTDRSTKDGNESSQRQDYLDDKARALRDQGKTTEANKYYERYDAEAEKSVRRGWEWGGG